MCQFGYWLTHIRVQHLGSSSATLECDIWSRVEPHWTARLSYDLRAFILLFLLTAVLLEWFAFEFGYFSANFS